MAVTTAFGQFETIIRENLGNTVLNMRSPEVDDPAMRMMSTFQPLGLGGRDDSNPGWQARRKLKLTRGGLVTSGQWDQSVITGYGDNQDLPAVTFSTSVAPNPLDRPANPIHHDHLQSQARAWERDRG